MSDETENQKAEADKASAPSDNAAAVPAKASAPSDNAAAVPAKASAEASKAKASAVQRSKKEKILIGLVVAAALGLIYTVFHVIEVVKDAQNPYAQTPIGGNKTQSEAELEREEANLQPKNPVLIRANSVVLHERPKAPAKAADKKDDVKGSKPIKSK
jgi:hypothetical protein